MKSIQFTDVVQGKLRQLFTIKTLRLSQLCAIAMTALLTACGSSNPQLSETAPTVLINTHLGFNVEGYKYKQSEIPCDIDTTLVEDLVRNGLKENIRMEAVSTADRIISPSAPLLAIDIDGLILGSEEHSYGDSSSSHLPSIKVSSALMHPKDKNFLHTSQHSCSILTLSEFSTGSGVMDLNSGVTICSATRKCVNEVSKDIVKWLSPHIRNQITQR